ncbi:hypothetical protein B0H65DRAFT_467441 [Neurospora tetraspora]|uniref:Uncharacterized protein n=1 Tax=Neurospora tetraspora TaxID=94610 RepID=A0AAE0MSK0_9PEZI|nr:hypothetical protein B0H65DRAFT_467441 [Neurospora tetraspora]
MDRDLDTILSQIRKGSSSVDKISATGSSGNTIKRDERRKKAIYGLTRKWNYPGSSTTAGRNHDEVDRSDKTKTSHAKGMTPIERFQAERFGDGPWNNAKDVYMPKK